MKRILMTRVMAGIILISLFFGLAPVNLVMAAPKEETVSDDSDAGDMEDKEQEQSVSGKEEEDGGG